MATKSKAPEFGFEAFADLLKVPAFDMTSVTEFHKKNVEAFVEAGRLVFDGSKAISQKNTEIAKASFDEFNAFTTEAVSGKASEADFGKTFEVAQAMLDKNVKSVHEIADFATEANQKVLAIFQDRYTKGSEELKAATVK